MNIRYALGVGVIVGALAASAETVPPLDEFIRDGRYRDGLKVYASPADDAGRFSLAVLQSLDGLQQFASGLAGLGLNPDLASSGIPFLRVAVPAARQSSQEVATPEKVAALFRNLKLSLQRANATLSGMDGEPFGVCVDLARARMDLDGDGTAAENEMLRASLGRSLGLRARDRTGGELLVRFDSADAVWLKGYTHFLTGVLDVLTAYDWMPVWNQCAHIVFRNPKPVPPVVRLTTPRDPEDMVRILDLVAAIHEMRLELVRRKGLRHARDEFRAMVDCSRLCWQRVLAETDDDHEWLPSPTQAGPGGAKVTAQQVEGWLRVLDELEAILKGDKLVPHWRIRPGVGVNVDKLVTSPPPLDPVLLIQGSALVPYLQEGPTSDRDTWRNLMEPFGPGFFWFALWSN